MPNWCDNTFEILARKEINDEIKQNVDAYLGRRSDNAYVYETTLYSEPGHEDWTWIYISVRTAYCPPGNFINHVTKDYKNVLLKGRYWIEGGLGAAEFEMSSDDKGHVEYHSHDEINQDYMTEEELWELSEEVTLEEIEWDQERVNQLDMWYYITGSTIPKERDRIECDLWNTYRYHSISWSETNDGRGIPAPSGMGYMYMIDFGGNSIIEDENEFPREEELYYNIYEMLEEKPTSKKSV